MYILPFSLLWGQYMAHQVIWTKSVTDFFVEMANLTDFEKQVLETRISGMTQIQQAFYFSVSERTIGNTVNRLKMKYDAVQAEHPDRLKPRRKSASETYMDTH